VIKVAAQEDIQADLWTREGKVEVVEKFTYLGSIHDRTGVSKAEVLRRIAIEGHKRKVD